MGKLSNKIVTKIAEKYYYQNKNAESAAEELINRAALKWKTVNFIIN